MLTAIAVLRLLAASQVLLTTLALAGSRNPPQTFWLGVAVIVLEVVVVQLAVAADVSPVAHDGALDALTGLPEGALELLDLALLALDGARHIS